MRRQQLLFASLLMVCFTSIALLLSVMTVTSFIRVLKMSYYIPVVVVVVVVVVITVVVVVCHVCDFTQ